MKVDFPVTLVCALCSLLRAAAYNQQLYEGEPCVEPSTDSMGVCCLLSHCISAQEDLRWQRGVPSLCSFVGHTPVVCCRSWCSDRPVNMATQPSLTQPSVSEPLVTQPPETERPSLRRPGEKAERMCAEYENLIPDPTKPPPAPRPIFVPVGPPKPATTSTEKSRPRELADQEVDSEEHDTGRTRRQISSSPASSASDGQVWIAAVGGEDAQRDEFPHMAAIGWALKQQTPQQSYAFYCGGSLISDRWVLTAGHCLSNRRDTTLASAEPRIVRLGDSNIRPSADAEHTDIPIADRVKHPNYKPPSKYYDIALIKLQYAAPLSQHIIPACLWTKPDFGAETTALVTGWGATVSGARTGSDILQKVKLDILETRVCDPLLASARNRNWQGFSEHQMCAGVLQGGKDACQGDSGGPLQTKEVLVREFGAKNKYHVIGVTSFGRDCAKRNLPGVYTRVSSFVEWIEQIVWP